MKSRTRRRPVTVQGICYRSITAALNTISLDMTDTFLLSKTRSEQVKIISFRLSAGWLPEQAFGLLPPPECARKSKPHPIICDRKVFPSEKALARSYSIPYKVLHQRLHRDQWPPEAAVEIEPPAQPQHLSRGTVGLVYVWEHVKSGKKYVGLTIDNARRAWQHLSHSRIGRLVPGTLQQALAMFGVNAFTTKILEEDIPVANLPLRERYWIKKLGTLKPHGYNQNRGGNWGGLPTPVIVDGVLYPGVAGVASAFNMPVALIRSRVSQGWTFEEAVGLQIRVPKTRTPVHIDMGGGETDFPTAAAACRYFGLQYGKVAEFRRKNKVTWAVAIEKAFIAQFRRSLAMDSDSSLVEFISRRSGLSKKALPTAQIARSFCLQQQREMPSAGR